MGGKDRFRVCFTQRRQKRKAKKKSNFFATSFVYALCILSLKSVNMSLRSWRFWLSLRDTSKKKSLLSLREKLPPAAQAIRA